jgi:hypothetical protein
MIDQVCFHDYISVGPQGELLKVVKNGQAALDYRIQLDFDDDPRFIKLVARCSSRPEAPAFVQLLAISHIVSITIAADAPKPSGKKS